MTRTCEADGCDWTPDDDADNPAVSYRMHLVGKNHEPDHAALLENNAHREWRSDDSATDTDETAADAGSDDDTDDDQKMTEQDTDDDHAPTDDDTDDMVSASEYEQQHSQPTDTETDDDQQTTDASGVTSSLSSLRPDVSPTTYLLVATALLAGYLLYRAYRSRSNQPETIDDLDDEDETDARNEVNMLE